MDSDDKCDERIKNKANEPRSFDSTFLLFQCSYFDSNSPYDEADFDGHFEFRAVYLTESRPHSL